MLLRVRPSLLLHINRTFFKLSAVQLGSRQTTKVAFREMNSETTKSVSEPLSANGSAQSSSVQSEAAESHVSSDAAVKLSDEESSHVEIQEGKARILFPSSNEVFYNPVQEFNRDLSIAVIKYYSKHLWTPGTSKMKRPKKEDVPVTELSGPIDREVEGTTSDEKGRSSDLDAMETEIIEKEEEERRDSKKQAEGTKTSVEDTECDNSNKNSQADDQTSSKEPGMKVLEALAASGLRSIRYALEIPRVGTVVANDLSKDAYDSMCKNIEHNQVGEKVVPSWKEASMLMYENREPFANRFDIIDLDPYGSPSIFLDSTVQAVKDGGLLCVTCTDMSVLCGTHSESCHSKYGAMSLKAKFCHEMALRIVLASLESHANRYRRYIVPLMSCSIDFYIRLFVRVFTSPAEVKRSPSKLAMVYSCIGCESYHLQPVGKRIEEGRSRKYPPSTGPPVDRKCDQCGSVFRLGGPIWAEAIHDVDFVRGLLSETRDSPKGTYNTIERINGLLSVISEELPDVPLYYVLDSISSTMHCSQPKMLAIRSAILNAGYRVSISHANANTIKTDAPHHIIWDIMRCWAQTSMVKQPGPHTPAAAILSQQPKINASFVIRKDANPPSRLLKLKRFPENPEANWGPKARAKRSSDVGEDLVAKRRRLQGKRTND